MKMNLSQRRTEVSPAGPGARLVRGSAFPAGNTASLTASIHEPSVADAPQCGQSAHRPTRSCATPLHSTRRHPGVQPGPTCRRHRTHLILAPGLCRWQRSQSGRPCRGGLVSGKRAACAYGEGNPAPALERPSAPSSPSDEVPRCLGGYRLHDAQIVSRSRSSWSGHVPTGAVRPQAIRSATAVVAKRILYGSSGIDRLP